MWERSWRIESDRDFSAPWVWPPRLTHPRHTPQAGTVRMGRAPGVAEWYSECMLSCYTHVQLCDVMTSSQPGSSVHGTLQGRILQWVATPLFMGSSRPRDQICVSSVSCWQEGSLPLTPRGKPQVAPSVWVQSLSRVQLSATTVTATCQASLSISNSRSVLKLLSIESVMTISSSVIPFSSCLPSFPTSGSFPASQFLVSGDQILELQLQQQSFQWIFRTDFL